MNWRSIKRGFRLRARPYCIAPMSAQTPTASRDPQQVDPLFADLTGSRLGEYVLVRFLGRGGMGQVYEARRDGRARRFAIKVLNPHDGLTEPLALDHVEHPNVVTLYEFGEATDCHGQTRPYLVMEYVRAAKSLTACARTLGIRDKLDLFLQVCAGLDRIHETACHHDLKPENILVGDHGVPKITDFGMARLRTTREVSRSGGTLLYMSPEQLESPLADLGPRSDVYALGLLLYELLTNQCPHLIQKGATRHEAAALRRQPFPAPSKLNPSLDPALDRLVSTSSELDPTKRYESAGQFGHAVKQYLENRSAWDRAFACIRRVWRRQPLLRITAPSMLIAALAILLALGVVISPVSRLINWEAGAESEELTLADLEEIRLIDVPDGQTMVRLAEELGPDVSEAQRVPVHQSRPWTWRGLLGQICTPLAGVADTIAFDAYFPDEHEEYDTLFAEGIAQAGHPVQTPVVLGTTSRQMDAYGNAEVPPKLFAAGARWGIGAVNLFDDDKVGAFVPLLIQDAQGLAFPSFPLAVYAASLEPDGIPTYRLGDDGRIEITFHPPSTGAATRGRQIGNAHFIKPSHVRRITIDPEVDQRHVYRLGDRVAVLILPSISRATLQQHGSIPFEKVLRRDPDTLADLQGKTAMVHWPLVDTLRISDDDVPNSYFHVRALAALQHQLAPDVWSGSQHLVAMAVFSMLGAAFGSASVGLIPLLRPSYRSAFAYVLTLPLRVGVYAATICLINAGANELLQRQAILMTPIPTACALVLAGEMAALWATFRLAIRNSRRLSP